MSYHVMLDLETLGAGPESVIIAIGAVKFDPASTEQALEKFYTVIDPASCTQYGLKMEAKTVMWWMDEKQNEARKDLLNSVMLDLPSALDGFAVWLGENSCPVWGNGAGFDNVILRNAYLKTGLEVPWKFTHDRCFRTLAALCPDIKHEEGWLKHNALNDAVAQTLRLQKIIEALDLKGRFTNG